MAQLISFHIMQKTLDHEFIITILDDIVHYLFQSSLLRKHEAKNSIGTLGPATSNQRCHQINQYRNLEQVLD